MSDWKKNIIPPGMMFLKQDWAFLNPQKQPSRLVMWVRKGLKKTYYQYFNELFKGINTKGGDE